MIEWILFGITIAILLLILFRDGTSQLNIRRANKYYDTLEDLKRLRQRKIITEKEFKVEKEKIKPGFMKRKNKIDIVSMTAIITYLIVLVVKMCMDVNVIADVLLSAIIAIVIILFINIESLERITTFEIKKINKRILKIIKLNILTITWIVTCTRAFAPDTQALIGNIPFLYLILYLSKRDNTVFRKGYNFIIVSIMDVLILISNLIILPNFNLENPFSKTIYGMISTLIPLLIVNIGIIMSRRKEQ